MKVKVISHTPNAKQLAFTAIRTCYSPYTFDYIWNDEFDKYKSKDNDDLRLIKQIVSHGHTSTLEHIMINISVEEVSRSFLAQLTRHRMFSFSVQSQRYVNFKSEGKTTGLEYVTPPAIRDNPHANAIFTDHMWETVARYDKLIELGVKPEDARFLFPEASHTKMIVSFNLRAFLEFYKKRNELTHAQWEIAAFAEELKQQIIEVMPWVRDLLL